MTDMARMLSVLNGGEVARRLGVSRTTVSDWAHSSDPPPARVAQVRALLLDALGRNKEADPPEWAGRLMRTVDAIAERLGVSEERAAIDAAVEGLLPSPPGGSEPDPLEDDPAGAGRRGGPG